MTQHKCLGPALLALALLPALPGQAVTYAKTGGGGDPMVGGELLSNAEFTQGLGDLTEITGALNFTQMGSERATIQQSYADLYAITLTGAPFSATTVGQTGDSADPSTDLNNTVLYLFDSHGYGVLSDELDPNYFQPRSTISGTLAPGLYYLGIGALGDQPTSGGGLIFPDQSDPTVDPTGTYGPTGPGGGAPLSGWDLSSGLDSQTGTYGIALTGVQPAFVPEPAPVALLGVGLGVLLLTTARRRPSRWAGASSERTTE